MIRVLHIITGLGTGGAEMMLRKILLHMDRTRIDNSVISLREIGDIGLQMELLNVPVYALNINSFASLLRGLCRTVSLIRAIRPNVIHTWLHHADLFGTFAAMIAGNPNIAWNIRCASLTSDDVPRINLHLVKLLGWLSSIPRVVVANSVAGSLAHTQAGYHPRCWQIIPNGFDTHLFSPSSDRRAHIREELGVNHADIIIGIVGRYHPMKGHALFLEAAKELVKKSSAVRFVMIGRNLDGDNIEILNQINILGLSAKVILLGERKDVPDLMRGLDILVCSSTSEGFSNVIGEAMACGVPCVATDVGANKAVIGDTGYIVASGDVGALIDACFSLLMLRPEDRLRLGNSARERIQSLYDIDMIAKSYQKLYEEMACASN